MMPICSVQDCEEASCFLTQGERVALCETHLAAILRAINKRIMPK